MASIIKVDKIDPQSGTALEVGTSGDTVTVPSGVGLTLTDSTLLLPTTVTATTEVKTNKVSPATGVAFSLGDSGDTFTVPSGATLANLGTATGFPETDLAPVNQDILTLALRQSVDNNSAKYNLPNSAITHFESDADYDSGGSTDIERNAAEYISSVATSPTGDANSVLLLHFDGNFTDNSTNAVTFTGYGSIATSTTQAKFGTHSCFFDGTDDYLSTPSLASLSSPAAPSTGDFTVDWWVYYTEAWGYNMRNWSFGNNGAPSGTNNSGLTTSWSGGTNYSNYNGTNMTWTGQTGFAYNQWDHYAIMRKSGTLYWFLNGLQKNNEASLGSWNQQGGDANLFMGIRSGSTSEYMKGYIDEFRYSDNLRYATPGNGVSSFTPETSAYGTTSFSATGTALGTTNVPTSAVTKVSGVMLMKNAFGTNTLGTDVKVYFTADNSNWTEATSYTSAGTFSTGITQITLGQTTVTSGSDVRWKIIFANQSASSKEAHIYGMGLNY